MGLLGWECTVCLCSIVITQANCFIHITHAQCDCNIEKMRLSTCAMKQSSLLKQMAQCFYWGPSLLEAEFVRGRDVPESSCQFDPSCQFDHRGELEFSS